MDNRFLGNCLKRVQALKQDRIVEYQKTLLANFNQDVVNIDKQISDLQKEIDIQEIKV
jgi:hypothetical protein